MGNKCCVSATSNPCKSRKVQNFNYENEPQHPQTPTARLPPLHQTTTMPHTNKHGSQGVGAETLRGHERSNSLVDNSFKSSHRRGIQQINVQDEDEERLSRQQEDNEANNQSQGQPTRRGNSNFENFTRPGTQQVEHDFQGADNQVNLLGSNLNVSPIVNQKMGDKNKPASPSSQKMNKNLTLQHARTHQPPTRSSARSQTSTHTEGIPQRPLRLSGKNSLDQEQSIQQEEELEMQDEGPLIQSKRSNPQVTCSDQIDIPKLKVSTTIGISKEWLPPNHQKSSVFPSSDQNVEEEGEEYYISDDAGVLRKKSSIHQMSFQKQSTISPKIVQYQKSLHPDFNPQATIGPLSFGGPVEGLEFTLQKNIDRASKGSKTGGRILGQGTITSSLDMSIHSFNPNAQTSINPGITHQNSMSKQQHKQNLTQHSQTHTGNNSRSNNTSHNGTKRQETSNHSKFRNKTDLRAHTMDEDELVESAGSAFSREGSSVVGINIINGSAEIAVRKDSFISQDIVSQQEKSSSNLNAHMNEGDLPYPVGSVLLPTPPSASLKQQQYLSILGNTNASQGTMPFLQHTSSLSADPSGQLDDRDKN